MTEQEYQNQEIGTQENNEYTDVENNETTLDSQEQGERETIKLGDGERDKYVVINGVSYHKEVVEEARHQGWMDQEDLRKKGKDGKYLAPDEFIDRGKVAVPFLHKKIDRQESELKELRKQNEKMSKLLEKQLSSANDDRMERVKSKLDEARENVDVEKIEKFSKQLAKMENENYAFKEETEQNVQYNDKQYNPTREQQYEQMYIENWNERNRWIYDQSDPRTSYAIKTFAEISKQMPGASVEERVGILEENMNMNFKTNRRSNPNFSPARVNNGAQNLSIDPYSIENLRPEYKKSFDEGWERCKNFSSYKNNKKSYEKTFLDNCREEFFYKK